MRLGSLIQKYRQEAGIGRPALSEELAKYGFDIPQSTLADIENKIPKNETDWNPDFIAALARIFDKTEIEILDELGFNVIPEGFAPEDVELARVIRGIPNPMKRRRAIAALLSVLSLLDSHD